MQNGNQLHFSFLTYQKNPTITLLICASLQPHNKVQLAACRFTLSNNEIDIGYLEKDAKKEVFEGH